MLSVDINGTEVKFDEDKHKYYIDDREVPTVTQITGIINKPALIYWAANCAGDYVATQLQPGKPLDEVEIEELAEGARKAHRKSGKRATTIGTIVHQFAEDYIQADINDTYKPELPHNEKAKKSAKSFLDWYSEFCTKPHETERICYHPYENYAGTYDLMAEIEDNLTVIDFKTSKGIYDEYWLQVVAYLKAEQSRAVLDQGCQPIQAGIIRFPKDGCDFEVKIEKDEAMIEKHWETFKACQEILHWQQNVV